MALRPFIIDCDTGRDDALAFWIALALDLPLVGAVASYGNTVLDNVIDNTARVLALGGRGDMPVWVGADRPSRRHPAIETLIAPRQEKAGNGLCDIILPPAPGTAPARLSAQALADCARVHGPLDYFIIGPATNFAHMARDLGSDLSNVIARVTMMGGKYGALLDRLPGADFNIACDPFAARALLESGIETRFVPMNATWPICLELADIQRLKPQSDIGVKARDIMIAHCRHFAPEPVFRFHDPSLILATLEPERFRAAYVDIICDEDRADCGLLFEHADGFAARIYETGPSDHARLLSTILAALGLS